MPVAADTHRSASGQDRMALASQLKAVAAQKAGHLAREITPVAIPQKKGDALVVDTDEHPRETTLESLARLKGVVRPDGTVTAGNASGVNDGACALLLADSHAFPICRTRRGLHSGKRHPHQPQKPA